MRKPALFIVFILFFMIGLAKPPKGFCVHPDGMYYQIFHVAKDSAHPVYGDYIYMHLSKHHPNQKEVFDTHIFNDEDGVELPLDKPRRIPDVTQIFLEMSAGDSAVVKIPASRIDSNGSDKQFYTYHLKLLSFKRKLDYEQAKKAALKAQRKIDDSTIIDFLKNKPITNAVTDSFGIAIHKDLVTLNAFFQDNDTVKMHYKGTLVNGVEFDNSFNRNEPLLFVAGNKQVIDGLDIALHYFRKGETGTIIIPSYLGYADKETGKIPPNSVLIFYVEFLQ